MDGRPVYVVFAGVNGTGKSTFFRSGVWRHPDFPECFERVNPDEIVLEQHGSWKSASDQLRAGKEALRRIDAFISNGISFTQETTLAGHRALKTLEHARSNGFRIILFYLGVDNAQIALERIAHRVEIGGHDIDADAVERRHRTSMANLAKAIDNCDEAHVYDNSIDFKHIASWSHGVLCWWGASNAVGAWLPSAMLDESLWRR